MALREYNLKRDFGKTPEPAGKQKKKYRPSRIFVVQKHAASRLHYDFRLELNGVLKSWAIPKGPSLNPLEKHLAVHVEDHPFEYKDFEGIIPAGEYGGGTVLLWDQGTWIPDGDPEEGYRKGRLKFQLNGKKLKGGWYLFQMKGEAGQGGKNWLLLKENDAKASATQDILKKYPKSVRTHRTLEEIAHAQDKVWRSARSKNPIFKKNLQISLIPPKARKGALPPFIKPQLATLSREIPHGDLWLHEIKFDGYRAISRIEKGNARIFTRKGNDWTNRFPSIAQALGELPIEQALMDGEIVQLTPDGVSDFQALQNSLREGKTAPLYYYLFDLLHWNGLDLTQTPLEARRVLLQKILPVRTKGILRFSDSVTGRPKEFYREACRHALEGVVSKRRDLGYSSGRSSDWLKTKCVQRQEFVIVGFTEPSGKRSGFGSLLLGLNDSHQNLYYSGLVGTGFTHASLKELHSKLLKLETTTPTVKLPPDLNLRKVHWVRPELVAEVEFTEWTRDGVLRHPSFEGIREDKSPREIVREQATRPPRESEKNMMKKNKSGRSRERSASLSSDRKESKQTIEGIRLTHPEKILYADPGITKEDLARYYEEVADDILPHLKNRPLSLLRCPEGAQKKCFYQKHVQENAVGGLKTVSIKEKEGTFALYPMANDRAGLITLVQMGVLEIHPWGSQADDLEHPDRMIFDLDPDPGVTWKEVIKGAQLLKILLEELELKSFVKTTGGKGLHVVLPLSGKQNWKEVKEFSKSVVEIIVKDDPDHYTSNPLKVKRKGKIFLDYLRNERGATAVAPYSTRARAQAPVSAPLFWAELDPKLKSDHFNVKNILRRINGLKKDPWEGFFKIRQSIKISAKQKLERG